MVPLHKRVTPHWEPNWEPNVVDLYGLVWTAMDTKALRSNGCGRLWTPVDTPWRFTDQKVGGSSPSGRAAEAFAVQGLRSDRYATIARVPGDFWDVSWSTPEHDELHACWRAEEALVWVPVEINHQDVSQVNLPWIHEERPDV
jgi:hypothetical protein